MEIRVTVDEVRASKSLTGQIKEALCKVLCHNLCVVIQSVRELGIEAGFTTDVSPHTFLAISTIASPKK